MVCASSESPYDVPVLTSEDTTIVAMTKNSTTPNRSTGSARQSFHTWSTHGKTARGRGSGPDGGGGSSGSTDPAGIGCSVGLLGVAPHDGGGVARRAQHSATRPGIRSNRATDSTGSAA